MVANGKLYVVGADFEERFCRPTKMLEKGAEATNTVAHRTAIYKLLCLVVLKSKCSIRFYSAAAPIKIDFTFIFSILKITPA